MSGSAFSACSMQGEENTKKLLGLSLNRGDCLPEMKMTVNSY